MHYLRAQAMNIRVRDSITSICDGLYSYRRQRGSHMYVRVLMVCLLRTFIEIPKELFVRSFQWIDVPRSSPLPLIPFALVHPGRSRWPQRL